MTILGVKEGHDGTLAFVSAAKLEYSLEAEKDSFTRCTHTTADLFLRLASKLSAPPDVIAVSGWTKGLFSSERPSFTGYFGFEADHVTSQAVKFFGRSCTLFSSTHERSHIWCTYALSPYPQGEPCYVLVWEGNLGEFYYIDETVKATKVGSVLADPGNKYTFLFSLADTASPSTVGYYDTAHPGKMMALAAYGKRGKMNHDERAITSALLKTPQFALMMEAKKSDFSWSPFYNIGVETQEFKDLARKFSDELYHQFEIFAETNLKRDLPLLIAGGCGLNCEWNTQWKESGLFSDVFIPPCTNDCGSAIGTAVDAQLHLTGNAKLKWTAYPGEPFVWDQLKNSDSFTQTTFSLEEVAKRLCGGAIIAWVEGCYEMGPRSLGHRSLLARADITLSRDRLNRIKKRESYRPIAPICLRSDSGKHFEPDMDSPYMLHFFRVIDDKLPAITHVDGSARVQTLSATDAPILHNLLLEYKRASGTSVLCNTSLNFKGRGFINRLSDLIEYAIETELDGFVVDGIVFWRTH